MKIQYYNLVKEEYELKSSQIASAAVIACALCNDFISGSGGPGNGEIICLSCGDKILTGQLRMVEFVLINPKKS